MLWRTLAPPDVVLELLRNEDFKYVRLLAALYVRLTARPAEVFSYLEPLYNDYRRVRVRDAAGVHLARMDECVRELLTADTACSVALPRLPKRGVLEEGGQLTGPRRSALAEEFQAAKAKREAERKVRTRIEDTRASSSLARARIRWKASLPCCHLTCVVLCCHAALRRRSASGRRLRFGARLRRSGGGSARAVGRASGGAVTMATALADTAGVSEIVTRSRKRASWAVAAAAVAVVRAAAARRSLTSTLPTHCAPNLA